jgi:uncharacterized integral membrane protein
MNHVKAILGILGTLFVIIVVVQNSAAFSETVDFRINLLFFEWKSPAISVYLVAIVTFLVGVLSMGVYGMVERFRLKGELRKMKAALNEKDRELNSLRNLPLTGEDVIPVPSSEKTA